MRNAIRIILILLTVSVNIGCDQVSKSIVREKIGYGETIQYLDNHLTLTKVENTGAFLSLGDSWPPFIKSALLLLMPLIVIGLGLGYLVVTFRLSRLFIAGACFIIGGGIGNLIDRFVYSSVTDFLHLQFGVFQTGIFNMADVSVMVGVGLILLNSFLQQQSEEVNKGSSVS